LLNTVLTKVIGTKNERELKRIAPIISQINELEPSIERLSDDELRAKTSELRQRLGAGQTLDELLPEAFAVVREAGRRVLSMRHFDVQLIGGITLHRGMIAEMKTGEGKTLVATLPAY
jgi:preprotein translocase subunit SecA